MRLDDLIHWRDEVEVTSLLNEGKFHEAQNLYDLKCTGWWPKSDYKMKKERARLNILKNKTAEDRKVLKGKVTDLLNAGEYVAAQKLYDSKCADWWSKSDFEMERERASFNRSFNDALASRSLAKLDELYRNRPDTLSMSLKDFLHRKLPVVRKVVGEFEPAMDEEQIRAIALPSERLLVQARAGSGKTRTICARAVLAIQDESLTTNQVLILAFNKAAADEVQERVHKKLDTDDYRNARTFHSLAYRLVNPMEKLLFDEGEEPSVSEQSKFVQRLLERILNPAFKERLVEFFRKELTEIERIGRDLPPGEYFSFRRSLEHITLKSEWVKSNGEKFIADFLFEHGIPYTYEKVWEWKPDFLGSKTPYKPDFSILMNGKDYVLEHWALDPGDPDATLPEHWDMSASEYREQIRCKRDFWALKKEVPFLETHTGMMRNGRDVFESHLKAVLDRGGIQPRKLPKEEIVKRVFENEFHITRMARLFRQFIQRAKKRGWSPDDVSRKIDAARSSGLEPRVEIFHELALRMYREYETKLKDSNHIDFDDLLVRATKKLKKLGGDSTINLGQGTSIRVGQLKWVLLDEYQDFSELYYRMIRAILRAAPEARLLAVGDDWQAINGFAGAELRFFMDFDKYFLGGHRAQIKTNYRCDRGVVGAGNRLMKGRGSVGIVASRAKSGRIMIRRLDDVWVTFRTGEQWRRDREADAGFFPVAMQGHPSDAEFRCAQALKVCAEIVRGAPDQKTLVLSRTNWAYGLRLNDFRDRLIRALSDGHGMDSKQVGDTIEVITAHRSKGREAHTVVVLDATARQFPKVHPDGLLFELFGVTPLEVLEEERRLFYVALMRAKHRLFALTQKGRESPFLVCLRRV